jgi:hypothetical protein
MRAGAAAGDQRIEHFGDAARLLQGLGQLAQRLFLAYGAGREARPVDYQQSVIGQRRKRHVYARAEICTGAVSLRDKRKRTGKLRGKLAGPVDGAGSTSSAR